MVIVRGFGLGHIYDNKGGGGGHLVVHVNDLLREPLD